MPLRTETVKSGLASLDEVVQGLRYGDNVVWQVDHLEEYIYFAEPFASQAIADGRKCIYLRFAPHIEILKARPGLTIIKVDPEAGFDIFSREVNKIIEAYGRKIFYIFDNLSFLVVRWATDELLANFFQVTCPYLFELETVAYFALTRGQHSHSAVARIRDTTQLLVDVYKVQEIMYLHPLKVWDRYSPNMFLPHMMSGTSLIPVFQSGEAAAVSVSASKKPLHIMARSIAPWESVFRRLLQYQEAEEDLSETTPEVSALKQELLQMMVGSHPEFNRLAYSYFRISDILAIRDRLIGSGQIGGKAAGMLLARRILAEDGNEDFSRILEAHDSFYIGSDVFFTFLVNNDLFRLRLQLTRSSHISDDEFGEVERRFLEGKFPAEIIEQFGNMLDYYGQAPIIVRSSSLLEDSFRNAFAGKYRSEFCANQGSSAERLEAFLKAVKLVYASSVNPDALSYRRAMGLENRDEQMAILVQRVSGMPYKKYFFPSLAGVACSRNLYVWTDRIDATKGLIRLVFGLGTRAVNRVGNDYPRMIAISSPELRPEYGVRIAKYSQWEIDVLDLEKNEFATMPVAEILADRDYPNLHLFISLLADDYLIDPFLGRLDNSTQKLIITFNNLIGRTDFIKIMDAMLTKLEKAYGHPLDTEFTASVEAGGHMRINLLQCRPMTVPGSIGPVTFPDDLPKERVLFKASRTISGGTISDIRYILYIDPKRYTLVESIDVKKSMGRVVGSINEHPLVVKGKIMMMGPGRWGSSNIDLGVNVSYSDINNASVLVEIAREEAGHLPEFSYGTHFFLDLVEAGIIYVPVYPNDTEADFNHDFFENSPNILTDLLPDAVKFRDVLQVIDVPSANGGKYARVIADPQRQKATCYIE
ncbi:MAG TPA: PEP/pyruvate-binding domain-containing protein [Syntrophales bacterium]|nr:PEP/pyruvate-binding domain-containing protein [Syntrophales bacterium]